MLNNFFNKQSLYKYTKQKLLRQKTCASSRLTLFKRELRIKDKEKNADFR